MKLFAIGLVFGIIVASVGLTGIARILDRGVESIKNHSQVLAQ